MTCSPVLATTSCGDHPVPGADRGPPEGRERAAWQPQAPALAQGQQQLVPVWCGQPHGWSSHLHERSLQPGPAGGWGDTEQPPGPASSGSHLPGWGKGANPPPALQPGPLSACRGQGLPYRARDQQRLTGWYPAGDVEMACGALRQPVSSSPGETWGLQPYPQSGPRKESFLINKGGLPTPIQALGPRRGQKSRVPQQAPTCHGRVGTCSVPPRGSCSSCPTSALTPTWGCAGPRATRTTSHAARKRASSWRPEGCGFQGGVRNEASGSTVREAPRSSVESGTCCPREEVPQRDLEVSGKVPASKFLQVS